jgi:hypothetical protein
VPAIWRRITEQPGRRCYSELTSRALDVRLATASYDWSQPVRPRDTRVSRAYPACGFLYHLLASVRLSDSIGDLAADEPFKPAGGGFHFAGEPGSQAIALLCVPEAGRNDHAQRLLIVLSQAGACRRSPSSKCKWSRQRDPMSGRLPRSRSKSRLTGIRN